MNLELHLHFPDPAHVVVKYGDNDSNTLDFHAPLDANALEEIRWYLEVYAAQYTADVDDQTAARTAAKLPKWGEALFEAVFASRAAQRLVNDFQNLNEPGRLLTIGSDRPEILSLPWELLKDPTGAYLLHEEPRISIRRKLSGVGGGREAFKIEPKERLRLLFVVSRPAEAGFIDPRSDAQAVMDALAQEAAGIVDVEFLRQATFDNLRARLEDRKLPPVDIVHFDGHGVFDRAGSLQDRALKTDPLAPTRQAESNAKNCGYLLFENDEGNEALISAETLGEMLHRKQIGLMVLSACQSAKIGGDEPMGSVAARLTHAGIPAVLAMTHSVLVHTTRELFGQFYKHLVSGQGIGEALDNARRHLYFHPERGERPRGQERVTLKLQDWFLPALYQAGRDAPLLQECQSSALTAKAALSHSNVPELQEAGFFGRSRELWQIERAFTPRKDGKETRRMTIAGFGGQGKTALACEAGRWLLQTHLFDAVCFVNYAAFQGVDAVGFAVSTIGNVLGTSLLDVDAAERALKETATLLILDNVESLSDAQPRSTLCVECDQSAALRHTGRGASESPHSTQSVEREQTTPNPLLNKEGAGGGFDLLTAAERWSNAGRSRVLITTRMAESGHPAYPTANSRKHLALRLTGLGDEKHPDDALAYFRSLMKLPPAPLWPEPKREALIELFQKVQFHPLSIGLLAQQLKTRRIAELGERLNALLLETPDNPLLASLNLSLDRLDAESRRLLPRLGVFQGGAMELDLLEITQFSEEAWRTLRANLETTGLIQAETLPGGGVPFLKFHPTLAPALWNKLTPEEQTDLLARHRARYYQLSGYLYQEDTQHPHHARAIALRELPNLLVAARGALATGDENAVEFVNNVSRFLYMFGLQRDRADLNARAKALAGEVGSQAWYLHRSAVGEQLQNAGCHDEAARVFQEILTGLGDAPNYERCVTLHRLGRCFARQGQSQQAAAAYRQELALLQVILSGVEGEQSNDIKRQTGAAQTDLADVLADMGDYAGARQAYQAALAIDEELGDLRGAATDNGQLGTLAMLEGNLAEAEQRHKTALAIFHTLNEPAMEATAWHQLGMVYRRAKIWDAAEAAYRESASLREAQGDLAGAAQTWNNLAIVTESAGKPREAEGWYRKALAAKRMGGNPKEIAAMLNNLADLLQNFPDRLDEARRLAEEALAIDKTLDPGAAEIWKDYTILSQIADKQGRPDEARAHRRAARQAKAAFLGTRHELQRHEELIAAVVAAAQGNTATLEAVKQYQAQMRQTKGWENMAEAIDSLFNGERDEDALCDPLHYDPAMILLAALERLRG